MLCVSNSLRVSSAGATSGAQEGQTIRFFPLSNLAPQAEVALVGSQVDLALTSNGEDGADGSSDEEGTAEGERDGSDLFRPKIQPAG